MPYAAEGSSHSSCFLLSERLGHGAERRSDKQKPRQQRLAVGDKVKDSAVPPRLTRHRCRVHSSTANTVRLLTRALRPRLLVTFRLGPPGPILSGSVSAGITPSPTLSQSVSRFLPVNGLLSCLYPITAFSHCQRILTRFLNFSYCAALQRAPDAYTLVRSHAYVRASILSASSRIPPASSRCPVRSSPHAIEGKPRASAHFVPRSARRSGAAPSVIIVNFDNPHR